MKKGNIFLSALIIGLAFVSCTKDDENDYEQPKTVSTVFKGSGDFEGELSAFRSALGDSLNNTPGKTSGRREINWDGVPASVSDNNPFPADFFNATDASAPAGRKRGIIWTTSGNDLRVSSNNFSEIDPTFGNLFQAFSPSKTFAYLGTTASEVTFRVAGTNTMASTKGFGVVFSDVDNPKYTTIEYFNNEKSLGVFEVPARKEGNSFSFLGVVFPQEKITKVKIVSGNGVLGAGVKDISEGGSKDLVIMDDFLYSEPVAVQ